MEDITLSRAMASHTARLDRTLRKLQDRVKEQEAALLEERFHKIWGNADLQITSSCLCQPGS